MRKGGARGHAWITQQSTGRERTCVRNPAQPLDLPPGLERGNGWAYVAREPERARRRGTVGSVHDHDELKLGSYKNQIRSRHGDAAERYAASVLELLTFTEHDSVGKRVRDALRLAFLDGALAELQTRG